MTKEKFIELVNKLSEKALTDLINGINQINFEYGWDTKELTKSELIQECWKENFQD